MTRMLASVNSVAEALLMLAAQVDIIDLKQPAQGALGALNPELVKEIVTVIGKRCPISATIGDLPMQAQLITDAVTVMADTGVDYIKIGFFPGGDWLGTINQLANLSASLKIIAVLFADSQPEFGILEPLKKAGFTGVMLDTMDKNKGSLTQVLAMSTIADFVNDSKRLNLLCGLAGSLRLSDIPELLPLSADYLGFRGALCDQHNRTAHLDKQAIAQILSAIRAD
ncbi:MAG: (5-formylfuran-3-yl)methyl phosphate synthase [Methylococcales bacterium]